jgi:hypothetical protein
VQLITEHLVSRTIVQADKRSPGGPSWGGAGAERFNAGTGLALHRYSTCSALRIELNPIRSRRAIGHDLQVVPFHGACQAPGGITLPSPRV